MLISSCWTCTHHRRSAHCCAFSSVCFGAEYHDLYFSYNLEIFWNSNGFSRGFHCCCSKLFRIGSTEHFKGRDFFSHVQKSACEQSLPKSCRNGRVLQESHFLTWISIFVIQFDISPFRQISILSVMFGYFVENLKLFHLRYVCKTCYKNSTLRQLINWFFAVRFCKEICTPAGTFQQM